MAEDQDWNNFRYLSWPRIALISGTIMIKQLLRFCGYRFRFQCPACGWFGNRPEWTDTRHERRTAAFCPRCRKLIA